jgi:hypothetical protein
MELDQAQRAELLTRQRQAMMLVILLERRLGLVVDALAHERVDVVVLKGPSIARVFYPNPSWRSYGDLDLLVRTAQWQVASSVLEVMGFRRLLPEPRRGFDERFGKGATHQDRDGMQVDLHRTLALGPFGQWIEPNRLFGHTETFDLGARSFRRLNDVCTFLHVCVHAALGRRVPLLMPLRDVLQIISSGRVRWDELEAQAGQWRLREPIRHAIVTAARTLDIPLSEESTRVIGWRGAWLERRVLRAYTSESHDRGGVALASLWAIPGIRAKLRFAVALLLPDRRFLAQTDRPSLRKRWRILIDWFMDWLRAARQSAPGARARRK